MKTVQKYNPSLFKIHEHIVKEIILYRTQKGLTQKQFAKKVGLSYEYVRRVESSIGKSCYSLKTLFKISQVLDVNVHLLFKYFD